MLTTGAVWFILVALTSARPQSVKPEENRSFTDNNVQKLARPSPLEAQARANNHGQVDASVAKMLSPHSAIGMQDPRAQMTMMMQAAQLEQMRRQAALGQANQDPAHSSANSRRLEPPTNNIPIMPTMMPGIPPMMNMQQSFGYGRPSMVLSPMMPPVSGKNITDGHLPAGPSSPIRMMQQQQMIMAMNEYARRQQQQANRMPGQEEMQQIMMAQAESREQFQRMAMLQQQQQQQALMFQQAALASGLLNSNSQNQMNDNTAVSPTSVGFQGPMPPWGVLPQGTDPRMQMQMDTSENLDPRFAMQIMEIQRMQKMSQDAASSQSLSISSDTKVPNSDTINSFIHRVRDSSILKDSVLKDSTGEAPAAFNQIIKQLPMMPQPPMAAMEGIAAMQDPRIQQPSMMQSPPVPGAMVTELPGQDPRMQQFSLMQSMLMPSLVMPKPVLPISTMQQPSLMTPTPAVADVRSLGDKHIATMAPVSGRDISITLPSIQHVMDLEARLLEARQVILRSFYVDLLKYRELSQQVQLQMNAKLAMLHQIEAQLATPLRYILATQTTTPRLNLPVLGLGSQSTIITRLRDSGIGSGTSVEE